MPRAPARRVRGTAIIYRMAMKEILAAYGSAEFAAERRLGMTIADDDPNRALVLDWAAGTTGTILDVGSATGRWAGLLAAHGHDVEGIEPAARLREMAEGAYPQIPFHDAAVADLPGMGRTFGAVLAWYSLIHMGPGELPEALATLRAVTEDGGGLLMSFYSGIRAAPMPHPATTAYRWPLEDITAVLADAGFAVTSSYWHRPDPPAHLTAVAVPPGRVAGAPPAPPAEQNRWGAGGGLGGAISH